MKLLHFASWFLAGASGISLMGWKISLTPSALKLAIHCITILIFVFGLLFVFDRPICESLDIPIERYWTVLAFSMTAIVLGILVAVNL